MQRRPRGIICDALSRGVRIGNAMKRTSLLRWMAIWTVKAGCQLLTFTDCPRCRRIFHLQSPFLNVPSNPSALNFPTRGCQPANRGAKGAVSSNRPADVRSIVGELSLPNNRRALDRHGNFCRFTLLNSQSCRADPPPIKRTGAARGENLTQLRKQQR